jgi:hypothetical protein
MVTRPCMPFALPGCENSMKNLKCLRLRTWSSVYYRAIATRLGDTLFRNDKRGRCGLSCAADERLNDYLESCDQTSGSTGVPSAFTAVRADGFNPRALTMVGATCVVAVSAKTVCG